MVESTTKKTKAVSDTEAAEVTAELTAEEVHDRELEIDELLEGLPNLRPAHKLRISHANKLARIGVKVEKLPRGMKKPSEEELDLLLDIVEELDNFFESIAADKKEYDEWASGKDYEVYLALFERYMTTSGESVAS